MACQNGRMHGCVVVRLAVCHLALAYVSMSACVYLCGPAGVYVRSWRVSVVNCDPCKRITRPRSRGHARSFSMTIWPRGPMDKASAYGAGDCRFESCRGHCLQICKMAFCGRLGFVKRTRGDAAICHSTCVRWKHGFSHRTLTPRLDKGCLSEQSQPLARCHKV